MSLSLPCFKSITFSYMIVWYTAYWLLSYDHTSVWTARSEQYIPFLWMLVHVITQTILTHQFTVSYQLWCVSYFSVFL
jgi:hypothetical protein